MEGLLSDKLAVSADKWVLADQVADFEPIYIYIYILPARLLPTVRSAIIDGKPSLTPSLLGSSRQPIRD